MNTGSRWALAIGTLAVGTAALLALGDRLDKAQVALVYVLLVLLASMVGGRRLGLALAAGAFLLFDFFFLAPYRTLVVTDPFDWLILFSFVLVAGVGAEMVHRLRNRASEAERRAGEIDRLASLGAATLNVARAEDALAAITEVIRSMLAIETASIHPIGAADGRDDLIGWVARGRGAAARLVDGTTHLSERLDGSDITGPVRAVILPLTVQGRTVGILELGGGDGFEMTDDRRRLLGALGYYAALGVERVRLEAEASRAQALAEADRLKDALLASVSHDLRTPLTTIKALATEIAADGEGRALQVVEETDRLNRLVADLLDLSRIRGGSLPTRVELNAVDELVGGALERVRGVLADRDVRVDLGGDGAILLGRFDLGHSIRILANLLENAHKYSPRSEPIEITVRRVGDTLTITVADRGVAVAAEERDRIFEPFYRPPGHPPDIGGAGLGLAIARRLATEQAGSLHYAPREGGGSELRLTLPAADFES